MQAIKRFMQQESAAAWLLFSCALMAFLLSNSPWQSYYTRWWQSPVEINFWHQHLTLNCRFIINEGLMTAFFLVVGLEIKHELLAGALNTRAKALLPAVAALGGMIIPALLFVACVHPTRDYLRGWAIPTATDIAFSLGILNLLAQRIPTSLKVFLTTLAIFDDLAAIMIIAFFYTAELALLYLLFALLLLVLLYGLTRLPIRNLGIYCGLGGALWFCLFKAGVHPTLSGILLAFVLPLADSPHAPAQRLKQVFHPWVPMAILPLFAFANAGVPLLDLHQPLFPIGLFWGCVLGLFIGKPLGVMLFSWLAVHFKVGMLPSKVSWRELAGTACLCGIGFTISLFIASLAFEEAMASLNAAKLGVLVGSLLSGCVGYGWLRHSTRSKAA